MFRNTPPELSVARFAGRAQDPGMLLGSEEKNFCALHIIHTMYFDGLYIDLLHVEVDSPAIKIAVVEDPPVCLAWQLSAQIEH